MTQLDEETKNIPTYSVKDIILKFSRIIIYVTFSFKRDDFDSRMKN